MKRKCILAAVFALAALALVGCGNPNIVDTAGAAVVVVRVSGPAQDVEVTPSRGELTAAGRQYIITLTDRSPLVVTVSAPGYRTVMLCLNAVDLVSGRAEREVVMNRPAGATLELTVKTSAKAEQLSLRVSDPEAEVTRSGKRFIVELPDRAKDYTVTLEGEECAARTVSLPASELAAGYCTKIIPLAVAGERVLELLGTGLNVTATGKAYRRYEPQDMVGGKYVVVGAEDLVELAVSDYGLPEQILVDAASLAEVYCTVYRKQPREEVLHFVDLAALEKEHYNRYSYEIDGKRTHSSPAYFRHGDERYFGDYLPSDCILHVFDSTNGQPFSQYSYRVKKGKLLPERKLVAERRVFTVRFIDWLTGDPVGEPALTTSDFPKPPAGYEETLDTVFDEELVGGEWRSTLRARRRSDLRFRAEDAYGNPYSGILPEYGVEPRGEGEYLLKDFSLYEDVGTIKLRHTLGESEVETEEQFRIYKSAISLAPDGTYEYAYPLTCTDMARVNTEEFHFLPEGAPEEERTEWYDIAVKLSKDSPGRIVEESRGRSYYVQFGARVDVTLRCYDSSTQSMRQYFINGLTLDEALLAKDPENRIIRVKPDPRFDR